MRKVLSVLEILIMGGACCWSHMYKTEIIRIMESRLGTFSCSRFLPDLFIYYDLWFMYNTVSSDLQYLFAEVFSDDLLDLLHTAPRRSAMEHLQGGCVLLGQQVVQSTQVLAHLDESAPVGTA